METEEIFMKQYEQDGQKVKLFLIKEKGVDVKPSLEGCTFRIEHSSFWDNVDHANAFYNSVPDAISETFSI
jgi:hypothetical protein